MQSNNHPWPFGAFIRHDDANPCLQPNAQSSFRCPVHGSAIRWEEKDVFNPAAVVRDGKVYLLYRAEDTVGRHLGTSRVGIAESVDGLTFKTHPEPVLFPDNDFMKEYEWEGGCEDPRIVESEDGLYVMTYTAFDGKLGRLCIATSPDLFNWTKRGSAFGKAEGGRWKNLWSKSGSIVCRREGDRLVATRINGRYWMYWGEIEICSASSDNLIDWQPEGVMPGGDIAPVIRPRRMRHDSLFTEPGPPSILTDDGIVLIYNGRNAEEDGDPAFPAHNYSGGMVLFDRHDPRAVIARTTSCFFHPERPYEITGQVGNVCFLEGLIPFNGNWMLYYGTADSKIAVASAANLLK